MPMVAACARLRAFDKHHQREIVLRFELEFDLANDWLRLPPVRDRPAGGGLSTSAVGTVARG
jgi:hypothetical protein